MGTPEPRVIWVGLSAEYVQLLCLDLLLIATLMPQDPNTAVEEASRTMAMPIFKFVFTSSSQVCLGEGTLYCNFKTIPEIIHY